MRKIFVLAGLSFALVAFTSSSGQRPEVSAPVDQIKPIHPASPVQMKGDFGKMPLYFIANEGQMDEQVAYYVQGKDKTLYFTAEGMTISLAASARGDEERSLREIEPEDSKAGPEERLRPWERRLREDRMMDRDPTERWVVKLDFVGANPEVKPIGMDETGAVISYFKGKPEDWHTGLATYSKVVYEDLWPGIDLVYSGDINRLKYEFIVHPGADPSQIRLAYSGADSVSVDDEGRLEIVTPAGKFQDDRPVAYQEDEGKRTDVTMSYQLRTNGKAELDVNSSLESAAQQGSSRERVTITHEYGFEIGDYDSGQTLIIDPVVLIYCGYIGGVWDECGRGIAVDNSGNVYVTGGTTSSHTTFPVMVGPDLSYNGNEDVFVAKVSSSGTALIYCGYIGGIEDDYGSGIALDISGNAYITGSTNSDHTTFPATGGPDLTYNGYADAFVAKVDASGTTLAFCGYIGGEGDDYGSGIAVDGSGNSYVTGDTGSDQNSFPVMIGPNLVHSGWIDAFVAKVTSSGAALSYCGYIGGEGLDRGRGIAVDGSGNAIVAGKTPSDQSSFPVLIGPDLTHNGNDDAFVAKLNATGTSFLFCGYIGGSGDDEALGIVLDGSANAYITGQTESNQSSFPVLIGPDLTHNGGIDDAFVAKINSSGTGLIYCGYIGGSGDDYGSGIAVDSMGNAYIAGDTDSNESSFPIVAGPDLTMNGYSDAYVAKINASGTALVFCGYVGGAESDYGKAISVDMSQNAYISGGTSSDESTFPVIVGPDLTHNYRADAFVAKISAYDPPPPVFDGHDYDGNSTSDISIYRPSNGVWYISGQSDTQWGMPGDIPIPGNYDLDAATEIAVFRPSTGLWYVNGISTTQWGATGDIPVPHDYNGGGVTDLAVWRPSDGVWYINGVSDVQWGQEGDCPVPGDYDGDGVDEIAVWRPANGEWFVYGGGYAQWGAEGDVPVPADYDGDGATDIAVFRPSIGTWYIQYSGGGTAALQWGMAGDTPAPGDYDGNGTTDIAIWRPSDGLWYIYGGVTTQYGTMGDIPLVR